MHIPKILQVNNWLTPSHKDKPSGATSQKRFNKLEPKRDLTQTPVFLTENNLLLMSMLMSICIPHGPLSRAHLYSSLRLIQYLSMHFYLQQQTIWQVARTSCLSTGHLATAAVSCEQKQSFQNAIYVVVVSFISKFSHAYCLNNLTAKS